MPFPKTGPQYRETSFPLTAGKAVLGAAFLTFAVLAALLLAFSAGNRIFPYFIWAALMLSAACLTGAAACRVTGPAAFACIVFSAAFALKLTAAVCIDAEPYSDFAVLFDAARSVAFPERTGQRFSAADHPYFSKWAYQVGFVWYQSILLRVFGDSKTPLLVMNALCMAGVNTLVYGFARRMTGDGFAARAAALIYLILPAPYFLAAVLTNQHIAALLIWLGLYILTGGHARTSPTRRAARNAAAGVIIAVGNVMRPVGAVAAAAGLCFVFFHNNPDASGRRRAFGRFAAMAAAFAAAYALTGALASYAVRAGGLHPDGLVNNEPLWKLVLGLNTDTYGAYSGKLAAEVFGIPDAALRRQRELELIRGGLRELPAKWPVFVWRKSTAMWAGYESLEWSFRDVQAGVLTNALGLAQRLDRGLQGLILLLALAGTGLSLRRHAGRTALMCMLAALTMLYAGAHLLVEVQPRYRYFITPCFFIVATTALSVLPAPAVLGAKISGTALDGRVPQPYNGSGGLPPGAEPLLSSEPPRTGGFLRKVRTDICSTVILTIRAVSTSSRGLMSRFHGQTIWGSRTLPQLFPITPAVIRGTNRRNITV